MSEKINKIKYSFLFIIICSFFYSHLASAASLSLLPSSTNVSVDNIVSLKVYVNTENKLVNNSEAVIQFPVDLLEILSITKSSSIFSLWVEEPSFSNSTGRIVFNGGVPNPGYIGTNGYVMTVTFKAKKQGIASVIFLDGAVRENDGNGTDVLKNKISSSIKIENIKIEAPAKETLKKNEATKVVQDNTKEIIKVFKPQVRYENNRVYVALRDDNSTESDYYLLQIDNEKSFKVKNEELNNNEYILPYQKEGAHKINIITFDKSGKYTEVNLNFESPRISAPIISLSLNEITKGGNVRLSGKTDYPLADVNIVLESNGIEVGKYAVKNDENGSFTLNIENINNIGDISIWAETILSNNLKSNSSEKLILKVSETKAVRLIITIFYSFFFVIILIIAIIVIFVLLYLGWHKFFGLKKKMKKELENTALEIHKVMIILKEELNDQLNTLENAKKDRNLNEKEELIFNEINKNINNVDNFIEKKLKKIL